MIDIDLTVDDQVLARLAALGLRVNAQYEGDVKRPYSSRQPDQFILSDMGAAGLIYLRSLGYEPRQVNPINIPQLRDTASKLVDPVYATEMTRYLGMPQYLDVLERFADHVERWGYPRDFTGGAWAMHCRIVLPPFQRPRQYRDVVKAYARIHEAGMTGQTFYDLMAPMTGAKTLERAAARAVFQAANPGLHTALVGALFA